MRKDEMINLLTEHAINETLDRLVLQNTEYVKTKEKADSLLEELERMDSSRGTHKKLDRYDVTTHEAAALYAKFAYQRGLKDMFNLIMSLRDEGEDITE